MISSRPVSGFTLLETVIAMAILALALMAIFDINASAISMHTYAKKLSVASLLARSKMTDLEQDLYDKGFASDDEEKSGDFSEEGWPTFKWTAKIIVPKTQGVSSEKLIGSVFNIPLGGDETSGKGDKSSPLAALGPLAGLAQTQFAQMLDQITQVIREVQLDVSFPDGKKSDVIHLVTEVVSTGPGSDRNGPAARLPAQVPGQPPGQLPQLPLPGNVVTPNTLIPGPNR